ncbi:MAG: hypothetical protein COA43_14835 [Robiginitomaculum sp.]|nr:MAG: hypothetical protein COA43_14835 [Robiginitomaculum sp.]
MALLTSAEDQEFVRGNYNIQYYQTTGLTELQYSVNSQPFKTIPQTSLSTEDGFEITIPHCLLKAVFTGDGVVEINAVSA